MDDTNKIQVQFTVSKPTLTEITKPAPKQESTNKEGK